MPTYNVSMGQAVSVRNLGEDSLVTGIVSVGGTTDFGRALASCSAVSMVNTRTGAAGLFHFPSGDITDAQDEDVRKSRRILGEMIQEISPDEVHFGHGPGLVAGGFNMDGLNAILPEQRTSLRRFVQSSAPSGQEPREAVHPVPAGAFLIKRGTQGGAPFEVDTRPDDGGLTIVDLSQTRAGQYPDYRVYGDQESTQTSADLEAERQLSELDINEPGAGTQEHRRERDFLASLRRHNPMRHVRPYAKKVFKKVFRRNR